MSIDFYLKFVLCVFVTIVIIFFIVFTLIFVFDFIKDVKFYASQSAKDFVRKLNSRRY